MSTSDAVRPSTTDAPLTLAEQPARTLGLRDSLGLWGNLGVSLLLPVAAVFVVLPGRPLAETLGAVVVGAVIGALLLGIGAAAGAREGVPAKAAARSVNSHGRPRQPRPTTTPSHPVWRTISSASFADQMSPLPSTGTVVTASLSRAIAAQSA